ncbi:34344_t:CDS:2, partial [Racocetra persica]
YEIDKPPDKLDCNNNDIESVSSLSYSYLEQDINNLKNDKSYNTYSNELSEKNKKDEIDDPIQEIFKLVFINDS